MSLRLRSLIVLLFIINVVGFTSSAQDECELLCSIAYNQFEALKVNNFITMLQNEGWIISDSTVELRAEYGRDSFSNVLETTTTFTLDGKYPDLLTGEIKLYIGNVGTVELDHEAIGEEIIEAISFSTNLSVFDSLLLLGMPDGGQILPIHIESDFSEQNPCPNRSHYVAYYSYDDNVMIVRAVVPSDYRENLLSSNVEIVYSSTQSAELDSNYWIGTYEGMDHIPCF